MDTACTVYVASMGEGTNAWRPVAAEPVGSGLFRLVGSVPEGENWEFQPGQVVRCQERDSSVRKWTPPAGSGAWWRCLKLRA